jgi:hypothetical protein
MSFDVVVSAGKHSDATVCVCVSSIVDNLIGYRHIYVLFQNPEEKDNMISCSDVTYCTLSTFTFSCENYLFVDSSVRFLKPISFMEDSISLQCWRNTDPEPLFCLVNTAHAVELFGTPLCEAEHISRYMEFMRENYDKEIQLRHLRGSKKGARGGDFIQI